MQKQGFALSVEELALGFSLLDEAQKAHDLMVAQLGEMTPEEARARLLAASHGLLARGLLSIGEEGKIHLEPSLERMVRALIAPTFSLQYSRAYRDAKFVLAYHFTNGLVLAHWLEGGVVHRIIEVEKREAVVEGGMDFFNVAGAASFRCPPTEIPYDVMGQIKDEDDPAIVLRRLAEGGVEKTTREMLAEDVERTEYRGSILRVEYDEDKPSRSDQGLLVLRGRERLWLFRVAQKGDKPFVVILPGTEEVFRKEVEALIEGGS